ncbi:conserved hypothetical protein [Chelatococcus asaccharovorans]|uniref:Uncharacterized protein n=1 Tax=Chelatococcus asaccharovorans TaxID=28210 RepID=A0A2V3UI48_9HYPH|nr:hypothetical protein C7450_101806 [Chelatococcus asaccharovorans]CAH1661034.1 conserved hypothetical protein [Chelatococcus asaccharovorans]CAH1683595.1 conserved hypothetical protein [Chelatococcus asaccharovorans]
MVLVELLNLTFDLAPHVWRDSNVKFRSTRPVRLR